MFRVKFAVLLAALVIGCTGASFTASYYFSYLRFVITEPYAYPCSTLFGSGVCTKYPHLERGATSVWYYSWPGVNPTHIHFQPIRSCIANFLYHDPLPPGTLRGEQQ
ncbi:MAG: hypothetical protein OXI52_10335 [Caldilineaceae bacterium]|nr:hypothetical protein [Caldilineaceae bacterium]